MKTDNGFTLLEVMVAISLFSIVAVALGASAISHTKLNNLSEHRSEAYEVAQRVLDELRVGDPAVLPTSGTSSSTNIAVGNTTYSYTITYCANTAWCASAATRHVKVKIYYKGNIIHEAETVFTQLR